MVDRDYDEKPKSQDGVLITVSVLIFIAVGFLALLDYSLQEDKMFSETAFYAGTTVEEGNPKELYDSIQKNVLVSAIQCTTMMTYAANPLYAGDKGYIWIVDGVGIEIPTDLDGMRISGSDSIKPFDSMHTEIVAPTNITFINSNTTAKMDGVLCIEIMVGTKYKLVFKDVDTWWCHIGKDSATFNSHTAVVGNNGAYSSCLGGYIIGQASVRTEVSVYEEEDGMWAQISFDDFLFKGDD